jgi:hypothetical protein
VRERPHDPRGEDAEASGAPHTSPTCRRTATTSCWSSRAALPRRRAGRARW